jgi:general secretion pathway protein I
MNDRRGFTLIEVLVALVVVALAMLALGRTAALQVNDFDALRERTLAGWVAANVLAETRLAPGLPATGTSDGRVDLGGRQWRWTRAVQATPDPGVRRIELRVFLASSKQPSASLTGFAGSEPEP